MASKFRLGYVGFANSKEMRNEINQIMGLINVFWNQMNSASYRLSQVDHNNLNACYQPQLNNNNASRQDISFTNFKERNDQSDLNDVS